MKDNNNNELKIKIILHINFWYYILQLLYISIFCQLCVMITLKCSQNEFHVKYLKIVIWWMNATLPQYRTSHLGYELEEQNGSEIPGGLRPSALVVKRVSARKQDRIAIGRKATGPSGSLSTLIILITWADCRNEDGEIAVRGDSKLHKLLGGNRCVNP